MIYKKTQVSLEFILLMTFMLFFFIIFLGAVQYRMVEITYEKEQDLLKEIGDFIKNEVSLAYNSEDGYYREFELPITIAKKSYFVDVVKNYGDEDLIVYYGLELRYLNQTGGAYVNLPDIDLPIGKDVIKPGKNLIQKTDGKIILGFSP